MLAKALAKAETEPIPVQTAPHDGNQGRMMAAAAPPHHPGGSGALVIGSFKGAYAKLSSSVSGRPLQNSYVSSGGERTYLDNRKEDDAYELLRGSLSLSSSLATSAMLEAALSRIPESPVVRHMDQIPGKRLRDTTEVGQRLRRTLLKGSVIVFVTAGYSGKRFIFEKAKELGVRTVVLESADSWSKCMEEDGVIEKFVPVDMNDADHLMDSILSSLQRVQEELGQIDGVTTFCEMAVPMVCRIAEMLSLPGNPLAAIEIARNKHACREAMKAAGLPSPASFLIQNEEQLEAAAQFVGFPAVIKPVNGAASLGVVRVNSLEEMRETYLRVKKEMSSFKVTSGALEQMDEAEAAANADEHSAKGWISFEVMVEEYLDGVEVDCDMILSEGEVVYGAVTDNWPTIEPWFNETGSNCPSILTSQQQLELLDLSEKSLKALGMRLGVFHVEAKMTTRGARLIEINSRMGGGPVRLTNLLVWGVDLVEEHLMASIGVPVRPPAAKTPLKYIAEYSINAPRSGVIENDLFLSKWIGHPEVIYARPLIAGGDKVTGPSDGLPTWLGEVMVEKQSVQEAIDFVKKITDSCDLPIRDAA